jgi:hypothetical protein
LRTWWKIISENWRKIHKLIHEVYEQHVHITLVVLQTSMVSSSISVRKISLVFWSSVEIYTVGFFFLENVVHYIRWASWNKVWHLQDRFEGFRAMDLIILCFNYSQLSHKWIILHWFVIWCRFRWASTLVAGIGFIYTVRCFYHIYNLCFIIFILYLIKFLLVDVFSSF